MSVAHAADEVTSGSIGDNITWVLYDDGTMEITGTGAMDDYIYQDVYLGDGSYTITTPWDEDVQNAIKTVTVSDGITDIGQCIFYGCENLTSVSIPNSVVAIDAYAFYGCSSLTSIVIPDSVTTIGDNAFTSSGLESINIPASVTSYSTDGFGLAGCNNLKTITVDTNSNVYTAIDNVLYNKEQTEMLVYPDGKTDTTYVVPDGVEKIYGWIFSSNTLLESIILPDSVTFIGGTGFSGCTNLKNINIPDGITYIDEFTFANCTSLESIVIPASVEDFGGGLFYDCTNMKTVTFEGDAPTFSSYAFYEVTVTAYYPANNDTWTSDVMQDYQGDVTWVAYGDETIADLEIASETVQASASYSIEDLLTEEELNSGSDINFVLSIEDANETVTDEDKSIIESALGEYVGIYYLDIDLTKYVDGVASDVTSTSSMISITVTIPEVLKETVGDTEGRYVIVRLHDGVTEILEDLDNDDNTITFETDKFSTYAIAFVEAEDTASSSTTTNTTTTPQTSDESMALIYGTLLIATGAVFVVMNRKRYMK